jgi:hypothetical protein
MIHKEFVFVTILSKSDEIITKAFFFSLLLFFNTYYIINNHQLIE